MSNAQPPRRPWPMKWVVIAIVVVIVPYTFLRWHYRKPGRAFEPAHDIKDRANTTRLLDAGFQRVVLEADRPVNATRRSTPAAIATAAGGLPDALATTLLDRPLLPTEIGEVTASANASTLLSYPIEFTCTLENEHQQLAGAKLYVRGGAIHIVPELERLTGRLLARTRNTFARLTVPPGALKPGRYEVTLIGSHSSRRWSLEVR